MSEPDYLNLYKVQDVFFDFLKSEKFPFYLTGGTALSRFYLNHRYSEDLDFFANRMPDFRATLDNFLSKIQTNFTLDKRENLYYDDFYRIYITENEIKLKIEFVNDVTYRDGQPLRTEWGYVDTPANILSNKLTALVNREEPKDIFDIVQIALAYKFNWAEIFFHSKNKAYINEIDVEQKIKSFPVELLKATDWFIHPLDFNDFEKLKNTIADDFLLGTDNSLCKTNTSIYNAQIIEY